MRLLYHIAAIKMRHQKRCWKAYFEMTRRLLLSFKFGIYAVRAATFAIDVTIIAI